MLGHWDHNFAIDVRFSIG